MTYQITVEWEKDFILKEAITKKIQEEIDTARTRRRLGKDPYPTLERIRELRKIRAQIYAHKNLEDWN